MENNISESGLLVDGVVILNENWNFVQPASNVYIPLPFILRPTEVTKLIKGNRSLRGISSVWTLKLFSATSFDISLVLCSNLRTIVYEQVSTKIRTAFNTALSRLKNSYTRKYHDQVKCESVKSFCILQCDFKEFGYKLEQQLCLEFQEDINSMDNTTGRVEVYFLGTAFGQNAKYEAFESVLNIDWVNVKEIIFHIAKDYSVQEKALLWRRSSLKLMFGQSPNYEYSNVGIGGCGNFYFVPNVMENNVCFSLVKMYSELTKYVKSNKLFQMGGIADFLQGNEGASYFNLSPSKRRKSLGKINSYLQDCDELERVLTNISTYKTLSARAECLVSVLGGTNRWSDVIDYARSFFEMNGVGSSENFFILDTSKVFRRLSRYIHHALTTLKSFLGELKQSITSSIDANMFNFTLVNCLSVATSEILCTFLLYGSAVSTTKQKRHNNALVKSLALNVRDFMKEKETMNEKLGNGNLKLVNRSIVYTGPLDSKLISHAFSNATRPKSLLLLEFAGLLSKSNTLISTLAKVYFDGLVASSLNVFNCADGGVIRTCRFSSYFRSTQVMHVQEFVFYIFRTSTNNLAGHGLVTGLRQLTSRHFLSEENCNLFYADISSYISRHLSELRTPFVFPIPKHRKSLIVVPSFGFDSTEPAMFTYVEAFNLKFQQHKISAKILSQSVLEMCKVMLYLPNAFWENYRNMDNIFTLLCSKCNANCKLTRDEAISMFT